MRWSRQNVKTILVLCIRCVISVGSRSGRRRWLIGTTSAHTADRKPARNIWLVPTAKSSSCGSGEPHQADERVLPLALLGGSPFSDPSCHLSCYSGVDGNNERVSSTDAFGLDTLYYVQRGEHAPPEHPAWGREEVFHAEQRTRSGRVFPQTRPGRARSKYTRLSIRVRVRHHEFPHGAPLPQWLSQCRC